MLKMLLFFIGVQIGICGCIYVPGDDLRVKPLNTKGIKTIGWEEEVTTQKSLKIQIHQSYSTVRVQQHEDDTNLKKIYDDNRAGKYLKPAYSSTTRPRLAKFNDFDSIPSASENQAKILPFSGVISKQSLQNYHSGKTANFHTFQPQPVTYMECPKGATGQFPHELSCNRFLNCYKGRGMTQNCPPGTLFNPKSLECDYSDKVDCISGPKHDFFRNARNSENIPIQCPKDFSGIIPHYENCSKFMTCSNGRKIIMDCPPGTLFDIKSNTCNHPQWSTCITNSDYTERSARLDEGSGFRGAHGVGQNVTANSKCPRGFTGLMEHHGDCSKFLNCANGRTFVQNCGPGTMFNPVSKVCDFPYNVKCGSRGELETSESAFYNPVYVQPEQALSTTTTTQKSVHVGTKPGSNYYFKPLNGHHYPTGSGFESNQLSTKRYEFESTTNNYGSIINHLSLPNYQNLPIYPPLDADPPFQKYPPPPLNYPYYNQQLPSKTNPLIQFNPQEWMNQNGIYLKYQTTTSTTTERASSATGKRNPESATVYKNKQWPPPFPSTDLNADYVFEYEDISPTIESTRKPADWCEDSRGFECGNKFCIAPNLVCDGFKDCPYGQDEFDCSYALEKFEKTAGTKLAVKESKKADNVTLNWCAKLCVENRNFNCKAFNYRKHDGMCFLLTSNVGMSGALIILPNYDYFEQKRFSLNCTQGYLCNNKKCINKLQVCDGINDCGDGMDEKGCNPNKFGYKIKLVGGGDKNAGRIEVEAFGKFGYICDDMFGLRNADVVCREVGFPLGALEVHGNSYYAQNIIENNTFYMMDDVSCMGNETSLMDCDFSGWGVHNCRDQEIVGIVCKTPLDTCPKGHWKCKTGGECLNIAFVCDDVHDCTDSSDEHPDLCDSDIALRLVNGTSKNEGRLEIRYHGIWGTVCDDDFNDDAAKVVCKELGYEGAAVVRKDGYFGIGDGPIWLDQVSCKGNESSLQDCSRWDWGEHNCEHLEDVGVTCSEYNYSSPGKARNMKDLSQEIDDDKENSDDKDYANYTLPRTCGLRSDAIFTDNSDVHFRVVQGSVAKPGDYPWQAGIRVKGKTKASHWCGAVVISQKFVLTAAHCLVGFSKGAYFVVAGDYNVDTNEGTEQEAYIEDFIIHESFRSGNKMNNDIALIKLKGRGFRLTPHVQAICLPEKDALYRPLMNCTVSGFGSIESGKSKASHDLRAGWIPVQSREVCKMPHVYGDAITEGMFCAGSLDEGVDACDGDSGGPLACLNQGFYTLFGLTSWGQHCGYANKPGVYTKVAFYRNWIEESMKKLSPN